MLHFSDGDFRIIDCSQDTESQQSIGNVRDQRRSAESLRLKDKINGAVEVELAFTKDLTCRAVQFERPHSFELKCGVDDGEDAIGFLDFVVSPVETFKRIDQCSGNQRNPCEISIANTERTIPVG